MNQISVYRDFEYIMVMFELNKKNYTERMYRTLITQKIVLPWYTLFASCA